MKTPQVEPLTGMSPLGIKPVDGQSTMAQSAMDDTVYDPKRGIIPYEKPLAIQTKRTISAIAKEIRRDWKNVNYAAIPYLQAMYSMEHASDDYGADSGKSIILYFLSNASSWRGETAKRVKAELQALCK